MGMAALWTAANVNYLIVLCIPDQLWTAWSYLVLFSLILTGLGSALIARGKLKAHRLQQLCTRLDQLHKLSGVRQTAVEMTATEDQAQDELEVEGKTIYPVE